MKDNPYQPPNESIDESAVRHSRIGIAAFSLVVLGFVIGVAAYIAVAILQASTEGGIDPASPTMPFFIASGMLLVAMLAELMAIGLGIASLFQRARKKLFGILAIVVGAALILGVTTGFIGRTFMSVT